MLSLKFMAQVTARSGDSWSATCHDGCAPFSARSQLMAPPVPTVWVSRCVIAHDAIGIEFHATAVKGSEKTSPQPLLVNSFAQIRQAQIAAVDV